MLRRTKGRILLAMLVVTGLAGTINNSTLSNKERKLALTQLKDTRAALPGNIRTLSENQLSYRPQPGERNIRESLVRINHSEKMVWDQIEMAMKEPGNPEKRLELTFADDEIRAFMSDQMNGLLKVDLTQPGGASDQPIGKALADFKSMGAAQAKYIKTTTEDLRNHFIDLPIGLVDCYQAILYLSGHTNLQIEQINKILAHPRFPVK